ncbi:MAG: periplasmic heavy metal sensor [Bacteroidales bacterium]|jgi:Spy/CpxP family protein refolding chaperone|nr:periplasmic heavy metal sensor [Bacteroidales bacterium]
MKLFSNIQIWIWVLATLLVVNMAVTGSILWHQHKKPDFPSSPRTQRMMPERKYIPMGSQKWKEEMDFTTEQWKKLEAGLSDFFKISQSILQKLNENQNALFEEINNQTPDLQLLDSLADELGYLHAQLRKESARHLLSVKAITTPEQYEKMSKIIGHWMSPMHLRPGLYGGHRRNREFR